MAEEYITIKQAAERIGCQRQNVYKAIRAGRLNAREVYDRLVVSVASVDEYIRRKQLIGPGGGRPRTRQAAAQEAIGVKRGRGRPRKQKDGEEASE